MKERTTKEGVQKSHDENVPKGSLATSLFMLTVDVLVDRDKHVGTFFLFKASSSYPKNTLIINMSV